ncbi:MAG TPA: DEAD/DEAH box helicase [Phycisphaerae bacterium]|nr:DEAD/DEAH box helicase [Phycisphaerae bacterium]
MTRDEICGKFLDSLSFDLYAYQEEALLAWFAEPGGVMVCAPTGMGKTLIAEAAVFEALHTRRRMYYTTPLIALTDQKFRELQALAESWGFSREDIGLITGNRRVNPDALVRVVVAEILLNHLLSTDPGLADMQHVDAVVMDEFHSFNDAERGIVWELSLVLLPKHVRVLLLSATVGNPNEFANWLRTSHGRTVRVVLSNERRVPLEFVWVEDKLLTDQLASMATSDDATNRSPALVFCFNRDECWETAEKLKGLSVISAETRKKIEALLEERIEDFKEGVGPKLRQMLIRGVGVHHAGVLPKHKEVVEELFQQKLVPFVICTETLAAGINLPARSVVMSTLLKGKPGEKKLIPSAAAHQIFGRAGRPQFDTHGYVFALAHEDDVKIHKWKQKYDQLDPRSKDLGIMKARKELERKRPSRRKTEQYWMQGHLKQLIEAGPAKLFSRSMIPYSVLIYLLTKTGTLRETREFVAHRFNDAGHIEAFQKQLDHMVGNLASLGYLERSEDGEHVTLHESIFRLLNFRGVDPLYGMYLVGQLNYADYAEKLIVLESVLELPPVILRKVRLPEREPGPLEREIMLPLMISMGVVLARVPSKEGDGSENDFDDSRPEDDPWWDGVSRNRPPNFPEMLKIAFEAKLAAPEPIFVQPKQIGGDVFEDCEFYRLVRNRELTKQEGLILRHLLRLVTLSEEFAAMTQDPDYRRIGETATRVCHGVDPRYTDKYLADLQEIRKLAAAEIKLGKT